VRLGYLLQFWLISTFGLGLVTARLPSALASLLACPALAVLGREAGIRSRTVLLAVFMILPIQLRYAAEGRNYSHGLLFVVVATWCLVRLDRAPGSGRGAVFEPALAQHQCAWPPMAASIAFAWNITARKGSEETQWQPWLPVDTNPESNARPEARPSHSSG
jgi:hypothetical protein